MLLLFTALWPSNNVQPLALFRSWPSDRGCTSWSIFWSLSAPWDTEVGGLPSVSPCSYPQYRKHLMYVSGSQRATASEPLCSFRTIKVALLFPQYPILQSTCIGYFTPAVFWALGFCAQLVSNSVEGPEQGGSEKGDSRHIIQCGRGKRRIGFPFSSFLPVSSETPGQSRDSSRQRRGSQATCTQLSAGHSCPLSAKEDVSAQPINVIWKITKYKNATVKKKKN